MEDSTQNQPVTHARWAVVERIGEWTWSKFGLKIHSLSLAR